MYIKLFPSIFLFVVALTVWGTDKNQILFLQWNELSTAIPGSVWLYITYWGEVSAGIVLLSYFLYRRPDKIIPIFLAALGLIILIQTLKFSLAFNRPLKVFPEGSFIHLGENLNFLSFPSGHSATAFFTGGLFVMYRPKFLRFCIFVLVASGIAFSRIALGVHFPLDILVGSALGWFFAYVAFSKYLQIRVCKTCEIHKKIFACVLVFISLYLIVNEFIRFRPETPLYLLSSAFSLYYSFLFLKNSSSDKK